MPHKRVQRYFLPVNRNWWKWIFNCDMGFRITLNFSKLCRIYWVIRKVLRVFKKKLGFKTVILLLIRHDLEWPRYVYSILPVYTAQFSFVFSQNFCFSAVLRVENQKVNFRTIMLFYFRKDKNANPRARKFLPDTDKVLFQILQFNGSSRNLSLGILVLKTIHILENHHL